MIAGVISGLFGLLLAIIGGLISLALFIFWVAMLIHALTNRGLQGVEKLVWVVVIIFLPVIGSLIYFFVGRKPGVLT
jgi:uncharacterized membrane protein YhaH (DUF805 family)